MITGNRVLIPDTNRRIFESADFPGYSSTRLYPRLLLDYHVQRHVWLPRRYDQSFPSPLSVNSCNYRIIISDSFINTSVRFIYSINIIINIISFINITIKMSDSSLSMPPMSEPHLPILPLGPLPSAPQGLRPFQLRRARSQPQLPKSDSPLFKDGLFSRTLLDSTPLTI
jgi:hypothetical protein